MNSKELIVVGGPNGAGKSTFVAGFLSERPCPYLSADLIAKEFPDLDPLSQQIAAGREFLTRLDAQIKGTVDFVVESTLSGRSMRNFLTRAKAAGFSVTVFFICLDSAELCIARVKARVQRGGHNVPDADIRRRFARSLANFWQIYREIADQWAIVYNVSSEFVEVAFGVAEEYAVCDEALFRDFQILAGIRDNG
ncbi:MAG: AAA family ATPase [Pirellulales bacterium]